MSSTPNNNNNGNEKLSINDNISAAPVNVKKKKSTKKSLNGTQSTNNNNNNNNNNINSYEHHLEKWIENTSKMNFDYSNENNYNNFQLMNSSFQQPYRNNNNTNNNINNNNNNRNHLQQQQQLHQHSSTMMDPNMSLPSQQFNSSIDTSPSISSFLNFNTSFKQQYPHLLQQRQQSSSSISIDPLASLNTQQEFFSLPSLGLNKLNTSTDQEKLNDVINQTRRFSDLLIDDTPLSNMNVSNNSNIRPLNESSVEDDEDDDQETDEEEEQPQMNGNQSKVPTENGGGNGGNNNGSGNLNNKTLLVSLLKQINLLHETNSKIFRNLHETKVEMEALKYAPSWGLRHRRDSVSGLSVHSQPYGFGGNSPAPTYHSQGNYTPGVVTDLIREVRDASRVRDESLLNRVKALIDEKSWSLNEANLRVLRELEEIKIHIHTLKLEKQNTNDRLHKLEDEVRSMRGFMGTNNIPFSPVQYAQFPATSNSNIAMSEQLKRSNLNLNYGVINSTSDNYPYDDHQQPQQQQQNFHPNDYMKMKRSSLPSYMPQQLQQQQLSPPKRQIDGSMNNSASEIIDEETFDGAHVMQMEKDTLKLRRDLQDALAGRKMAESRILALEHMVTSLKTPTNHHHLNNNTNNNHSMSSEILLQQQLQHLQTNGGSHETKRRNSSTQMEQLTLNTSTGSGTTTKMSSPKPQKASQVIITANPSGPVTDL